MERLVWVIVDSPKVHIPIVEFSKDHKFKVLSHMLIHENLLKIRDKK